MNAEPSAPSAPPSPVQVPDPEKTLAELRNSVAINRLMIATQFQMMFGRALADDRKSLNSISESWNKWREAEGIYDPLNSSPVPNSESCCSRPFRPGPPLLLWAIVFLLGVLSFAVGIALR